MSNFFKLVANENMKIYRRPRTWCLIFITILITITYGIIINYNSNKEMNWEVEIAQQIEINKHYLEDDSWKGGLEKQFEREIILAQYALDHQNYANYERSLWTGVKESEWILFFVILFTILIAAGIVAEEFTKGTIKLLLIRPVSRFKILLSKYVSTFLFAGILLIAVFLVAVLTNSFYHGFGDFGHQYLYLDHQMNVVEGSMFLKTIEVFLWNLVSMIMMVTFAFMLSIVFRSTTLAVSLSYVAIFIGKNMTDFLLTKYSWAKYILFAHFDLTQYVDRIPVAEGMTLQFSLMMLFIYFLLFNVISYLAFAKRDIAV